MCGDAVLPKWFCKVLNDAGDNFTPHELCAVSLNTYLSSIVSFHCIFRGANNFSNIEECLKCHASKQTTNLSLPTERWKFSGTLRQNINTENWEHENVRLSGVRIVERLLQKTRFVHILHNWSCSLIDPQVNEVNDKHVFVRRWWNNR